MKDNKKIIFDYFKETHAIILTENQYGEIVDKKVLANYLLRKVPIEWEWTVILSGSCFSCCSDGANSWIKDNLGDNFTVNMDKVIWNPNWQPVE